MSGADGIGRYEALGIHLSLENGGRDIHVRGPHTEALLAEIRANKPALIRALTARTAWALLYSETLKELLVVADLGARVPERLSGYPRYTFEEAEKLEGCGDCLLRAAHAAKKALDGTVVDGPGDDLVLPRRTRFGRGGGASPARGSP
jgi:hypothetical protein